MTNDQRTIINFAFAVGYAVLLVVLVLVLAAGAAEDEVRAQDCTYSDMLPFELQEDSNGHKAGDVICLHIDIVNDAPTPEEVAKG